MCTTAAVEEGERVRKQSRLFIDKEGGVG